MLKCPEKYCLKCVKQEKVYQSVMAKYLEDIFASLTNARMLQKDLFPNIKKRRENKIHVFWNSEVFSVQNGDNGRVTVARDDNARRLR